MDNGPTNERKLIVCGGGADTVGEGELSHGPTNEWKKIEKKIF